MKPLFSDKAFSLQSSKIVIISEMRKKSCFGVIFLEKKFLFKMFCSYFCTLKTVFYDENKFN